MSSRFPSLPSLLKYRKMTVLPMVGDGNCFYRAVAAAYYNDIELHHMLRRTVMEHMMEDADTYSLYFESARSFHATLNANKRLGVWNSNLADLVPAAVSRLLDCRVEVYSLEEDGSVAKYVFGTEKTSPIRLLHTMNHYDLLCVKK